MKSEKNKIYFASDFHLGDSKLFNKNNNRELKIIKWLEKIKGNAKELYLVGDTFDFWYEYNDVVPKGNHRFFSKIIELIENSTDVFFITGNHDLWMNRYIENEIGGKELQRSTDGRTSEISSLTEGSGGIDADFSD